MRNNPVFLPIFPRNPLFTAAKNKQTKANPKNTVNNEKYLPKNLIATIGIVANMPMPNKTNSFKVIPLRFAMNCCNKYYAFLHTNLSTIFV